MDTFLKALEEAYSLEPADRFMETSSIWQTIAIDLARSVVVDPADMNKLSEKYVAVLVEKNILHPIPHQDMYQTLNNLLYAFIAKDNTAKFKQNFPRGVQTSPSRGPGLQERGYHGSVPDDLREADLQVAAGPVPIRLPQRQKGTEPGGFVQGQ